ncbi:MAG: hypothetical protein WD042_01590 [Phycisphaeraceae bacterium]
MTPVHPNQPFRDDVWSWRNEEIDRYNAAALEFMRNQNVPINDAHALIAADPDRLLNADGLHLSEEGNRLYAEAVVRAVEPYLAPQKN